LSSRPQTGFKWTVASYFDVDSRGIAFSTFFLPPAKLGAGSFYLGANFDGKAVVVLGSALTTRVLGGNSNPRGRLEATGGGAA